MDDTQLPTSTYAGLPSKLSMIMSSQIGRVVVVVVVVEVVVVVVVVVVVELVVVELVVLLVLLDGLVVVVVVVSPVMQASKWVIEPLSLIKHTRLLSPLVGVKLKLNSSLGSAIAHPSCTTSSTTTSLFRVQFTISLSMEAYSL